jgi:hypothetical protein
MSGTFQIEAPRPQPEARRFPVLLLVVAIAVIGSVGIYFWSGAETTPIAKNTQPHLPFGSAEQAYARQIQIENAVLSRAENFIHQEVTTLSGELVNTGNRSLRDVQLTIEFSDELHQVVLRETRALYGPGVAPLAPGSRREFEVSFDHVPSSWNMQPPAVRVTGIEFKSLKE